MGHPRTAALGDPVAVGARPPAASMLEREAVVAATGRLLERAGAGRGGCLFVVGESGLGKTAALQAAVQRTAEGVRIGLAR